MGTLSLLPPPSRTLSCFFVANDWLENGRVEVLIVVDLISRQSNDVQRKYWWRQTCSGVTMASCFNSRLSLVYRRHQTGGTRHSPTISANLRQSPPPVGRWQTDGKWAISSKNAVFTLKVKAKARHPLFIKYILVHFQKDGTILFLIFIVNENSVFS